VKLRDLAARLDCRLDGDGDVEISGVAGIHDAGPGEVTFVANPRYLKALAATRASAVILHDDPTPASGQGDGPSVPCPALRARDPYLAFARAVGLFAPDNRPAPGVHATAAIAADAVVGDQASIGPFVSIGAGASIGARTVIDSHVAIGPGTRVGEDCWIHSHVSLRERVAIGNRVVLQNGVVIGGDGYGFVRRADGSHEKIPQVATVVIEDDVEIGANTTVDRPAVGETRIKAGAKIDNLVQIGHGVAVGRNTLLAAQVGVSGSTAIGDNVILGGQVGVGGHLTLGDGSTAVGQSGVTNSLEPNEHVAGYPAIDQHGWRRSSVIFKHLPQLKRRLEQLEARIARLAGDPKDSSA
jgi:UDP-3-O-[3-hydroxymyristoyl] glucosamine N-acyltransferase